MAISPISSRRCIPIFSLAAVCFCTGLLFFFHKAACRSISFPPLPHRRLLIFSKAEEDICQDRRCLCKALFHIHPEYCEKRIPVRSQAPDRSQIQGCCLAGCIIKLFECSPFIHRLILQHIRVKQSPLHPVGN